MAVPSRPRGIDAEPTADDESRVSGMDGISVHTSRPGRRVFVEEGNTDGWIATDRTVELER